MAVTGVIKQLTDEISKVKALTLKRISEGCGTSLEQACRTVITGRGTGYQRRFHDGFFTNDGKQSTSRCQILLKCLW